MYRIFIASALALFISLGVCADADEKAKDLALLKDEMERIAPSTLCTIDVQYHAYANGVIGSASVILPDIVIPNTHNAVVNVVIKRHSSFTKWKQSIDTHNGWVIGGPADKCIHYRLFRRFSINGSPIVIQIPDTLSYDYVAKILTYFVRESKLVNVYTIERKDHLIIIRTLDEYIGPLNARGLVFEIELDPLGDPIQVKKISNWVS